MCTVGHFVHYTMYAACCGAACVVFLVLPVSDVALVCVLGWWLHCASLLGLGLFMAVKVSVGGVSCWNYWGFSMASKILLGAMVCLSFSWFLFINSA